MSQLKVPPRNLSRASPDFYLDSVVRQGRKLPNRAILHAKSGWGKTSFAAQIPGCIFLMVGDETGLWTLMDSGQLPDDISHFPKPASTKHELLLAISELAVHEHAHKALVLDSITQVEKFLMEKVCKDCYEGNWNTFNEWGADRAMKVVASEWDEITNSLDNLRNKGMGVFLIGHSDIVNFKNPDGPDYERWAPAVGKHTWKKLLNWSDMVLFGDFETFVDKRDKKKNDAESKG